MEQQTKKIIIIGGGIAGLTAGIYAQKAGFASEIYEKNAVPGGQCIGWNRNGIHIDNCIHWLTGTRKDTMMYRIWNDVGALSEATPVHKSESFYTATRNGASLTLWRDIERTRREFIAYAPEDTDAIHHFLDAVKKTQNSDIPAQKPFDMMSLFDLLRLGKSMGGMSKVLKEYGALTTGELAAQFTNPLLRQLFVDLLGSYSVASNLIFSYATITAGNGDIPLGGSLAMVQRMAALYQSLGGQLKLSALVQDIEIRDKQALGIRLSDHTLISADYVLCATDAHYTFHELLHDRYTEKVWLKYFASPEKYGVNSGLQAAFLADRKDISFDATLFFDCEPFEAAGTTHSRIALRQYGYEPSFAPADKVVLQVNFGQSPGAYDYWRSLSKEQYREEKARFGRDLQKRIEARLGVPEHSLTLLDAWTPLTYERYCNAYYGSYMSFMMPKGEKSFYHNGKIKGVKNLLLATQWQQSPGGLPCAAVSGRFAIQRILKKEGRSIWL